ncbi:MAG: sigma-70 family RNA polymerase sigma factor [bacterium]
MNPDLSAIVQKSEEEPGDALWVKKARAGEADGWAELHRRYYVKLWSAANRIVEDESLAEDVVQESFVKAFKEMSRFRGQSKFSTWLYRITVNRSLDAARKKSRRQKWLGLFPLEDEKEDSPVREAVAPEPSLSAAELGDYRKALAKALKTLGAEQRAVVELRLIQGLSTEETAAVLRCKNGTVLSRLFYSCRKLQSLLRKTYEETK